MQQLTVADEALCLLALYYDDLPMFQWLFSPLRLRDRLFTVGVSRYNLLHLSAYLNSFLICKWLIASFAIVADKEVNTFDDLVDESDGEDDSMADSINDESEEENRKEDRNDGSIVDHSREINEEAKISNNNDIDENNHNPAAEEQFIIDQDARTLEGQNIAHLAVVRGHSLLALYLINTVVTDKNLVDSSGHTFRYYASNSSDSQLTKWAVELQGR